jgi:hypothetical protein
MLNWYELELPRWSNWRGSHRDGIAGVDKVWWRWDGESWSTEAPRHYASLGRQHPRQYIIQHGYLYTVHFPRRTQSDVFSWIQRT